MFKFIYFNSLLLITLLLDYKLRFNTTNIFEDKHLLSNKFNHYKIIYIINQLLRENNKMK